MAARFGLLAALIGITLSHGDHRPDRAAITLRVEPIERPLLPVEVVSTPPGSLSQLPSTDAPRSKLVLRAPVTVVITPSARTVTVKVVGPGAVRLHLEEGATAAERALKLWGRDVTLSRETDGEFRPVAKAIPLYP